MPSAASASAAFDVSSLADEAIGLQRRPRRLDDAVEVAARAEGLLDLVEVPDRARAVCLPVRLVERSQQAHPEALARGRGQAELRSRSGEKLPHLALADRDERAFEPRDELGRLRAETQLRRTADHLDEPRIRLQLGNRLRVAPGCLDAVDELADSALLDGALAERGQHVRDVLHERAVRPDDEDAAARERVAMAVEEIRSAVKTDRGLAGAGATLDHERRRWVGRDQPVLVGLDRRDDVAHVPLTAPLELFEQEVADGCSVHDRAVQRLVRDVGQRAARGSEPPAQRDTVRIGRGRGVERPGRWSLPVDDELAALLVVDPAAADVETAQRLLEVETSEAEALLGVLERAQALGRPGVHRRLRDLAVHAVTCACDDSPHTLELLVRVVDVGLLALQLRMAHGSNLTTGPDSAAPP